MEKAKGKGKPASRSVVNRLPRYYRFLLELEEKDVERISSSQLADSMRLTASQIRQDLSCFGGFGQQGYGYNVKVLRQEIARILGLHQKLPMVLIGVGNLGRTLARHMDFSASGFELVGLFDVDPNVLGDTIGTMQVQHMDELPDFCQSCHPAAAVLCIPKEVARETACLLLQCGIRQFWNFSHYDIALDFPSATVENVHLGDSLMTLRYFLNP